MQAHEAATGGHLLGQLVEVRERRVAGAAVGVDHDAVGLGDGRVGRPLAAEGDLDVDEVRRALPESRGEQLDAGIMLVLAGAVAGPAGDEEDVLLVGRAERGGARAKQGGEGEVLHG